jgi:hypothetical protein
MSNALSVFDPNQLPRTYAGNADDYKDVGKTDYLLRLSLYSKGKPIDKGLIKPGHFGVQISKDRVEDLGDSIDVLFLAKRYKAVDMSDPDALIVVFDKDSDEYKRIEEESKIKDSNCMAGVDFLLYESSTGRFLDFHCSTKSADREAGAMMAYLPISQADIDAQGLKGVKPQGPVPATLKSEYVTKKNWAWFAPQVQKCSNFTNPPSLADVSAEITKFITEKGTEVETAPADNRRSR